MGDINHSTLEELNEKVGRMSEEKMKMEIENAKRIEVLELSKKMAEDERLSQQELARETIRELEETISVQKQQHVSSTEASKELLESMERKLCAREKELDDIKVKCTEKEEKLDDCEDKIIMLSKERECDKTEMEEKIKLLSIREEEANEMIRQRDMLKDEICDMKIVLESATIELEKEKARNETNSHTIEELNEEVRRITEEKMKIQNENGKSIEEGEIEYVSQQV